MTYGYPLRKALARALLLMLLASGTGFLVNAWHPAGYELVPRESLKYEKITYINTEEMRIKHTTGSALMVDARPRSEYIKNHIKGAVNIPALPESLSMRSIQEHYSLINGPVELVIYCSSHSCSTSETLARRFAELGYSRTIYLYENGIESWQRGGYPTEEGDETVLLPKGDNDEKN